MDSVRCHYEGDRSCVRAHAVTEALGRIALVSQLYGIDVFVRGLRLIVEIGTLGSFGVCAGCRCIFACLASVFFLVLCGQAFGQWSAFGWVLERPPAYDWPERLTTNSRSFLSMQVVKRRAIHGKNSGPVRTVHARTTGKERDEMIATTKAEIEKKFGQGSI